MKPAPGPIIIYHRRNSLEALAKLTSGWWIEVDVDIHEGVPVLTHDPLAADAEPRPLEDFLPRAMRRGAGGFVFDCKRENAEKLIKPMLERHKVADYFYLNEMEVQGDIYLAANPAHKTAIRIWQYRGAKDLIRYAKDMQSAKQNAPGWAWIDCWQRGLMEDIAKAHNPLTQTEARELQRLGVKLCVCSPELYVHSYDKTYKDSELQAIYHGVVQYRKKLMHAGILSDAVCTKFPWLWTMEIDLLMKAKNLGTA